MTPAREVKRKFDAELQTLQADHNSTYERLMREVETKDHQIETLSQVIGRQ